MGEEEEEDVPTHPEVLFKIPTKAVPPLSHEQFIVTV